MKNIVRGLKKWSFSIGLVLFLYILLGLDSAELLSVFSRSNLTYIVPCALLSPSILVVQTARWYILLRAVGVRTTFGAAWKSMVKGAGLGEVTPGKLGEIMKAAYLAAEPASASAALTSVIVDRLLDLVVLLMLASASGVFLAGQTLNIPWRAAGACGAGLLLLIALIARRGAVRSICTRVVSVLLPGDRGGGVHLHLEAFFDAVRLIKTRVLISCVVITTGIWALKILGLFLLSRALWMQIAPWPLLAVGLIAIFITLLPVSVSGVGTRDAVYVLLLSRWAVPAESAVAMSLLYLIFGAWGVALPAVFVYVLEMAGSIRKTGKRAGRATPAGKSGE